MKQVNWFERKFNFETAQNIFPSIIERLWGSPARLEEKLSLIPPEITDLRLDNSWSIKENIGHLTDLEPLWMGRLEDILNHKLEMRATDLQNTKTTEANHNASNVKDLLSSFRKTRTETVRRLQQLTEEDVFLFALHPRLKTPFRTMDLFLFVAEHDDHHLARITNLANTVKE